MTLEHSDYSGGSYQAHFRVCNSEMQIHAVPDGKLYFRFCE